MNSSALKRLVSASGVAVIYGTIVRYTQPSHSLPQSWYLNPQQQEKIRELESFKLNLALEANELIENLNHVLFQELQAIHQKYSFHSSPSSSTPSSPSPSSLDELDRWVKKHTKHGLPSFNTEFVSDERINRKLRVIFPKDLQKLYQPNLPTSRLPSAASINQSVDAVIEQFYSLEHQVLDRFSQQQLQVNDTIRSLRTKIFAEKEFGPSLAIFSVLSQLLGCQVFLSLTSKFFEASKSPPLVHPIRPFSTPITLALMLPIAAIIGYSAKVNDDPTSTHHLSSPTNSGIPGVNIGPGVRVVMPSPSVKHLPRSIYHFTPSPPIHYPCTDRNDPWRPWSVLANVVLPPIAEGYIFRKLLYNSLLSSTSPLKANVLVAVAVTACHAGVSSDDSPYYEIKHSLSGAYDVNHPPEQVQHTFSIPLQPLMIQLVQYTTGSVFVSTFSHAAFLFLRNVSAYSHTEDLLFSPIHSRYYDHIVRIHSYLRSAVSFPLVKIMEWSGKTEAFLKDGIKVSLLRDILLQNVKIINDSKENPTSELKDITISTEDLLDIQDILSHQSVIHEKKLKPLMPPKFHELETKKIPTPPFSHRKESGYYYEHFLPNSKIGSLSFDRDCRRLTAGNLAVDGKVNLVRAMFLTANDIPSDFIFGRNSDPTQVRQFKRNIFYWDEKATEEELLDLIHELNAHVLEKILRSVDLFRLTRGAWMCMELQGRETLEIEEEQEMLERYLLDLEKYLAVVKEREWQTYACAYGLSSHRLQSLVTRRGREHPELVKLWKQWEEYFQSNELREKVRKNGNPFPICRPRQTEEDNTPPKVLGGSLR